MSLYLIEILHQTTTFGCRRLLTSGCILSKFYIKPQRPGWSVRYRCSCILSKFYIKPQLRLERELTRCVVSYRNSTSNHNTTPTMPPSPMLYLIEILHQTTTRLFRSWLSLRCILSKFYIKPQPWPARRRYRIVVSYRNSTSNHNRTFKISMSLKVVSYRNSTSNHNYVHTIRRIGEVVSYRNSTSNHNTMTCCLARSFVVSYRNSTSNHNF